MLTFSTTENMNGPPSELKSASNVDTFKSKIREKSFKNVQKEENDIKTYGFL